MRRRPPPRPARRKASGAAHPPGALELLRNPGAISVILSSAFLVTGALYNLGLLILFDPSLISTVTLADHVATSVHVLAFGVLFAFLLFLVFMFLAGAGRGAFCLVAAAAFALRDWRASLPAGPAPARPSAWRRAEALLDRVPGEHSSYLTGLSVNGLSFLLIWLLTPPGVSLTSAILLLTLMGALSALLYAEAHRRLPDWGAASPFLGGLILVFMLAFQLGVLNAVSGLDFVLDPDNTRRPHTIGQRTEPVHILRAGSNGVFYLVRSQSGGLLRFEPWQTIDSLGYRIDAPPG